MKQIVSNATLKNAQEKLRSFQIRCNFVDGKMGFLQIKRKTQFSGPT